MRIHQLFTTALIAALVFACKEEPPPAPATPPSLPALAVAQAPAAPAIVYASAEPQHGGMRQRVGDYMVELATGADGKIDAYVQKYEGDVPSFEDVQVEMQVEPKAPPVPPAGQVAAEQPPPQDVIFYPKDGKLQGTVAGLAPGAYNVGVKIVDIKDEKIHEQNFENVNLQPIPTSLEPTHGGDVKVVDKTKMEVVQEGQKIKVWLRDLEDNKLEPSSAAVKQVVVPLADGTKEEVAIETKDDHFEGEIKGQVNPDTFKISMAQIMVQGQDYPKLRVPRITPKMLAQAKKGIVAPPPPATTTEAKKAEQPTKMKGTVGSMSLAGSLPPAKAVKPAAPPAEPAGKAASTKTKQGKVSSAKKAQ